MTRSYYQQPIQIFLQEQQHTILGQLASRHEFALEELQRNAWLKQMDILKNALSSFDQGYIFFEYGIPRMGRRVDNLLILNDLIFVLEFKVGDSTYGAYAKQQVIDYCLDLQNFHSECHQHKIIPILVATRAHSEEIDWHAVEQLKVPVWCNEQNLSSSLQTALQRYSSEPVIDIERWNRATYKPTPTIIEAAQALYKGHKVDEISRSDAGAINLNITSAKVEHIIEYAKKNKRKAICFLTGVPGAGKTLAGLNIANQRLKKDEDEHTVFLSGNGPLVDVLREALVRQTVATSKQSGQTKTRSSAEREAKAFIQNIHHFRDEYLKSLSIPIEKVVIFDEAQRAWRKEQVSNFMKQKKGIEDFNKSEPQFLIEVMDRHKDWCVIVCLIGGGQEINTGEAGVEEWVSALECYYSHWDVFYSEKILNEHVYLHSDKHKQWLLEKANSEKDLHLAVSVRSFRSEKIAEFVQALLDEDIEKAKHIYNLVLPTYPIYLTRSLYTAKDWLRQKARGSERYGLIASSGARRLKADGLDIKNKLVPADWFLNTDQDVRSSYYLEDVATEFDVQGLEVDYACVAWDINFYYDKGWCYQAFKGSQWQHIHHEEKRKYLLNTYRVLLTRARQGMIIYIPKGDDFDWTRPKKKYNAIYDYLKSCGIQEI